MGRGHTEAAVDEYGFKRDYVDLWGDSSRDRRDERTLITAGNWIMIIKSLPVSDAVAPQLYGIYWAVPFVREGKAGTKDKLGHWSGTEIKTLVGVDEYGRQCAKTSRWKMQTLKDTNLYQLLSFRNESEGCAWKRTTSSAGRLYIHSTRFTDHYRRGTA